MVTEIPTLRIVLNGMARNIADPAGVTDIAVESPEDIIPIYTLGGVKISSSTRANINSTIRSLPKGIYIVGGRKYTR